MANKRYVMTGFTLLENFKTAITKNFLSDVQLVDFEQNVVATETINDWVKEQTHEEFQDLIFKDDLDYLTRLVLVNAIYFKGKWKHPFLKERTKIESFYLNTKDKIDVHIKEDLNYENDDNLGAQILELPYTNEDLSMIIILPYKKEGISKLEKKLAKINLTDLIQKLYTIEVQVSLPRFKIEATKLFRRIFDQDWSW